VDPLGYETTWANFYNGVKYFIRGFKLIKTKMIPEGKRAYNNAPRSVQLCMDVSMTMVEYGVTKLLPIQFRVPYDIYSGANFNTMPTSKSGWFGYFFNTPLS